MILATIRTLHRGRLALMLFVLALCALSVPTAFAHSHPTAMMPAANETVTAPTMVMLHLSEAVEPKFSKITVMDAAGKIVSKDAAVIAPDGMMMTVALPTLPHGIYTVKWVTVALDSHRAQGEYKFTVK